jgi:aconitate hydratase
LGGLANFASEYATKRYRSNLINWGMIPFLTDAEPPFKNGDYIFIPNVKKLVSGEKSSVEAQIFRPVLTSISVRGSAENRDSFVIIAPELNQTEKELLLSGSLINYNRNRKYHG